jgi:hypothetical protein
MFAVRKSSGRYGGHRDRTAIIGVQLQAKPYQRDRPKRGARPGIRSSGVGGLAGGGSRHVTIEVERCA